MPNQVYSDWTPEIDEWLLAQVLNGNRKWKTLAQELNQRFGTSFSDSALYHHSRRLTEEGVAQPAVEFSEEKVVAENKELLKRRFEARLLQQMLDEKSRTEQILDALRECMATLPRQEIELLPEPHVGNGKPQSVVLAVSDVHVGQVVNPVEVGGLNAYNFDVFQERLERWTNSARSVIRHHQQAHPVREMQFWHLGDLVEGDKIFKSQRLYMDLDLMQQLFRSVDIWAAKIVSFLDLVEHIHYKAVPGNHGRIGEKGDNKSYVNWDYVLAKCIEMKLEAYKDRISFEIPESFFIVTEVEGWNWLLWHGDDIKSWASIPWYGVQRSLSAWTQMFNIMGRRFDYAIHGHFHTDWKMDMMLGEAFANGSWVGTNEHALRIRAFGMPKQLLLFVHPTYGVTGRYPLILSDPRKSLEVA